MEYFVDEMRRDCASCKHYHMNCADGYSCSKLKKEIHPNFSEGIGYRHQDCPLQSLSDYTKQVRKELCEEIRNWCDKNFNWVGDGTGYDGQDYNEMIGSNNTINKLRELLDQIQDKGEQHG